MMLASHDDPFAAMDFRLCDLAEEIEAIGREPGETRAHFRDRIADLGASLLGIAAATPRQGD